MSMEQTKLCLKKLLDNKEVNVIALSGKWGTGKSFMWQAIRAKYKVAKAPNSDIKSSLQASLFGVTSIAELKLKLCLSATSLLDKNGALSDTIKSVPAASKKIASDVPLLKMGLNAIDAIALLTVPSMLKQKLIVLDDIERKHDKLTIDEILGFIDDFQQNYGCRFLLILNTDELTDKTEWETFREKVIDEELRLETTPAEAFNIAIGLTPSQLATLIQPSVEKCELANIRIIRKIIRATNNILGSHMDLPTEILTDIIPTIVLLSAVHFKGIVDGPTMDFVLGCGAVFKPRKESGGLTALDGNYRGVGPIEEENSNTRWAMFVNQFNIDGGSEFARLFSDYLKHGLFDQSAVNALMARYSTEHLYALAPLRVRKFYQSTTWNPSMPLDQMLREANTLLVHVPYCDYLSVTTLFECVTEFEGGEPIASEILKICTDSILSKASEPSADPNQFNYVNITGKPLNPAIEAALKQAQVMTTKALSLMDVIITLSETNSTNASEDAVLQSASVDDFERTILDNKDDLLKTFLIKNVHIYVSQHLYQKHVGSAPTNFLKACRKICAEHKHSRWPALIKNVFKLVNREADLVDTEQPVEAATI